ncbi:MAG: pyruvate kinase, partial [Candidatus Eisenbacteria bacterium]|nr:pyruvate kinase [Candidatus Eisenbacteria bacterium]
MERRRSTSERFGTFGRRPRLSGGRSRSCRTCAGPKIRVGHLPPGGIVLSAGEIVPLEMGLDAAPGAIPIEGHAGLASEVRPGEPILLDDGAIRLRVLDATPARIRCEVLAGGPLLSGKGVNLPDTRLSAVSYTHLR